MIKIDLKHATGYEDDFALWSEEQAALLRAGKFDRIDLENIAEEIESLGRSDKHEITSRLTVILVHLLKWEFQDAQRSNSWAASILQNRDAIADLIDESPSLRSYPAAVLARAYRSAPLAASGETRLELRLFPTSCPYSIEQVLDPEFYPGPDR